MKLFFTFVGMFSTMQKKKTEQLDVIISELIMWQDDPISGALRNSAENRRKSGQSLCSFTMFIHSSLHSHVFPLISVQVAYKIEK